MPVVEPAPQPLDTSSGSTSDFTRLHISPLDADLLKIVLPAAVAAQARNISYHSIETFPERRYGFVELPTMEADKLKRKLNGSVLKGTKLRVEKARPEHREEPTGEPDEEEVKKKKKKKKKKSKNSDDGESSKKRKRDREVVEGVALTDRKVKRGWTEPADQRRKKSKKDKESEKDGKTTEKKKRQRSKYTDQDECLLKVKLPLNAVGNLSEGTLPKKRKKRGNAREITVHEFEKTTKFPSFLKNAAPESAGKSATEFVEGKGWVDEEGNVVENVKTKPKPKPKPAAEKPKKSKPVEKVVQEESDDDATSSSGTSSSGTSSDEESDDESEEEPESEKEEAKPETKVEAEEPQEDEEPASDDAQLPVQATPVKAAKAENRPMSASSTKSLTIKIPPPLTPSSNNVHPLEALYKRAKPGDAAQTPAQESKPFSFFGADIDEEEGEDNEENARPPVPMTPFTRQDLEWRGVRSAAPTPDTAHPKRMRNFWASQGDEDEEMDDVVEEEEEEEEDEETDKAAVQPQAGSSEFQTWFWENRRDLNRSWMNRRKTASKEKRHRDNKSRASKAV